MATLTVFFQGPANNGNLYSVTQGGTPTLITKDCMSESPSMAFWQDSCPPPSPTFNSVFFQGQRQDGNLYMELDPGSYIQQVANVRMSKSPSVLTDAGKSSLYYFYQGSGQTGALWYNAGGNQRQVPNTYLSESPSAVLFDNVMYVFHQGKSQNGQLWCNVYTPSTDSWSGDKQISINGTAIAGVCNSPSAVIFNHTIYVFWGDSRGVIHYVCSSDGISFTGGTSGSSSTIPNALLTGSPCAVVDNNNILTVLFQGANHCGQLWTTYQVGTTWQQQQFATGTIMSNSPAAILM